jgi:hypothetical protein
MKLRLFASCIPVVFAACLIDGAEPTAQELQQIKSKLSNLNEAIDALQQAKVDDDLIADVEVARHAVELALRFP